MNLFLDIETIPSERARERLVSGVTPVATDDEDPFANE